MQTTRSIRGTIRRHPGRWLAAGIGVAGVVAFALYWFAPWNLFVDRRVDEALPTTPAAEAAVEAPAADAEGSNPTGEPGADAVAGEDAEATASGRTTLAVGEFRVLEHATTGTALVIELEDGSRFLRLEDLATSNGPDLRVIVSDQPVSDDWHVWDDGAYLDLGPLKGNIGSSNYQLPSDLDLSDYRTAVIWCRRFSVGFGVAPLRAAAPR
jgi:Electron transfer DM13